ncbi:hypothetical protein P7D22_21890 [Lichenihabitans sp. Uapishka_5]|uniref:DUF6894 family protein n=1 Tax=Lichenihabitans sp. Uapishka_5 TaxID=3037302 RepID=UPI0029E7F6A9|nr:hypothetical protein [Lichenihabitans sp. Uapishka_5]MDX7953819.1 hypothetical protein [Lichenihabitans sp. Uapishka_5]
MSLRRQQIGENQPASDLWVIESTGMMQRDEEGTEFADLEHVRKAAMRLISDVARDAIYEKGDDRSFVVVVTDENRSSIYSATLTYTGIWMPR